MPGTRDPAPNGREFEAQMAITTEKPDITAKNYLTVGPGEYPCGNNLYLIVAPSGGRRWSFRWQRNGLVKKMGFGSAKHVKPSNAKTKALDALRQIANEIDPRESRDEKRRAEGARLFGEFADEWRQTYETGLKHKNARAKLKRIVEVITLPLHKMRLGEITTAHIITVLDSVQDRVEVQRATRRRIKQIMDAAIALDQRSKNNPADLKSRLEPVMGRARKRGKVRGKHKGIHYNDLPTLMQTLAGISDQSARAIELVVYTVARTQEVRLMRWDHLDLEKGLWNLEWDAEDGDKTKNERLKRTPLTVQALAYLREAHESRICDFVFPGRDLKSPMSNNTMLKHLKEITDDETLTVHGFRSTFRSWAQDETEFDRETVEHCMHHILGDAAEQAYKDGEALKKRRKVLQAFADYATRPPAKVVAHEARIRQTGRLIPPAGCSRPAGFPEAIRDRRA
jgi:integrase